MLVNAVSRAKDPYYAAICALEYVILLPSALLATKNVLFLALIPGFLNFLIFGNTSNILIEYVGVIENVKSHVLHVQNHVCGHALIKAPVPYHVEVPAFVCLVTSCAQKHLNVAIDVSLFVVKYVLLLNWDASFALLSNVKMLW